jgi:hypothetical protein
LRGARLNLVNFVYINAVIYLVTGILDVITTLAILNLGGIELNPLFQGDFAPNTPPALTIKIILTALLSFMSIIGARAVKKHGATPRQIKALWIMTAVPAAYFAVIVLPHNFASLCILLGGA